jgi:hypothetical protein
MASLRQSPTGTLLYFYGGHHHVFFRNEPFDNLLSGAHVLPSLASGSFGALASVRCAI